MTAAQKARLFVQIWSLLDSDQPGERAAALEKLRELRAKMGWPTFGELLRKLENTVAPEQLEALETNLAQWMRAHDERVTENAALARRNTALAALTVSLRTALWFSINFGNLAAIGVVIALGYGGYRWWTAAPAPDQSPAPAEIERAALDAALRDVLSRMKWQEGDSTPVIVRLRGVDYWLVVRGSSDTDSHVDAWGRPIERHCLRLYAREAVRDGGAYLTPAPYAAFGWWMRWPERAAECRNAGRSNSS